MLIKDTQTLNFPTNTFETIESEIAVTEYPDKNFADLIPIRQVPANTETLASLTVDYSGKAGVISGVPGEALPKIDFTASKETIAVIDFGFSFDITQADMRATANGNIDVLRTKLEAGAFAERSTMYDIAVEGNSDLGLLGLKNHTAIPTGAVAGANKLNSPATTAQEAVNIFMNGFNQVSLATLNARAADTVIMGQKAFLALTSKVFGDSGRTALDQIQASVRTQTGRELTIRVNPSFTTDIIFYQFDAAVLRMYMAQPLTYFAPEIKGLGYEVSAMFRFSPIQPRLTPAMYKLTAAVNNSI